MMDALSRGAWEGPTTFAARQRFLRAVARWFAASQGMPSLLGCRIHPLPHQLYAVRRVLADEWPRYLLADEVGLGKTIEAGLVIQALRGVHPDLRILVVAPGAMARQWLCELFIRFGEQVFALIDAGRLALDDAGPLLDRGRAIVSFTALETWPGLRSGILDHTWDLVVIDEAHQLQTDRELYSFLRELSLHGKSVLALSATPSRRDLEGLCGLLALVDPEGAPRDAAELKASIERGGGLEKIVCNRRADVAAHGTRLCGRDLEGLDYHASAAERDAVAHLEAHPRPPEPTTSHAAALQTALCALYRIKAAGSPLVALELLTTRRQSLADAESTIDRPISDPTSLLSADPGPEEEDDLWRHVVTSAPPLPAEIAWLEAAEHKVRAWAEDAVHGPGRFRAAARWIQSLLDRNSRAKVLVFSGDPRVVEEFEVHLEERLGNQRVAHIHHRMDEATLAFEALRFQSEPSCSVLVSDELGGEGRNFQFASAVVHLDLPWSPARLEQRIGRLDRMGRDPSRTVLSVVPRGPSRTEAALLHLHADALAVFTRSLGGLDFLLAPLHAEICRAFLAGPDELERLGRDLATKVAEERARAAHTEGLGAPDPDLYDAATQHAASLAAGDPQADEHAVRGWLELLGGLSEPLAKGEVLLGWNRSRLERPLDIDGDRVRRAGTFMRHRALLHESREWFAPGHPLIDELVRDLLDSDDGRRCAFSRDLGDEHAGRRFVVVTGWVGSPETLEPPHELVHTPRWPRLVHRVVALGDGRDAPLEAGDADKTITGRFADHVAAAHSDSDRRVDVDVSEAEIEAAIGSVAADVDGFEVDSVAVVVGADET